MLHKLPLFLFFDYGSHYNLTHLNYISMISQKQQRQHRNTTQLYMYVQYHK